MGTRIKLRAIQFVQTTQTRAHHLHRVGPREPDAWPIIISL